MVEGTKLQIDSREIGDIGYDKLDVSAFIKWVTPTIVLQPYYEDADLTIDDILYQNKKNLGADACQRLMRLLWPSFSDSIHKDGRQLSLEEAKAHLLPKDQPFLREQNAHVVFGHRKNIFVAELELHGANADVVRCWKAPSADIHPATIFVTFKDVAEKERFDSVAEYLGHEPSELLLSLARDFASKLELRLKGQKTPTGGKSGRS